MIRANPRRKNLISVLQLGTIDYATGLSLQQKLVALRKEEKIGDVLLLLEHTPVITLGRNAKAANVVASPELLKNRGVELFECDRGGDVTFHGPGQIVGYPIFDLRGFALSSSLSSRAEENDSKSRSLQSRDPVSDRLMHEEEGHDLGRAVTDLERATASAAQGAEAKLAAIGVHISRFVTSHGFALNVNTDLSYFNLIVPCGITTKPVTSMAQQLGKNLDLNTVAESISRNFGVVFQSQILWLESLDALLGSPLLPTR